jgi:hypothetical protein
MINNTLTLSEQYNTSSKILYFNIEQEVDFTVLSFDESLRALDILYSIELRKNKIRNDLSTYFEFAKQSVEIDFLEENPVIINILPSIAKFIQANFENKARLELELFVENTDWKTLFINVYTNLGWERVDNFIDKFLDNLYELYPGIAQKLNLNIVPNEF